MMEKLIFIMLFYIFPPHPFEAFFKVSEKNYEIKIISDGENFRLDLMGKFKETYFKEKTKIFMYQDGKWKEIKKPVYTKENFFLKIFFENGNFDIKEDNSGINYARVFDKEFGEAVIKRISFKKLEKIEEGIFPKKSKKPIDLSKIKSLIRSEDEKGISATAGARGVGEEENLDAEPNFQALLEIEKIKISMEEVERFAKEGGLK